MLVDVDNQFRIVKGSLKHNGRPTETVTIAVSSDNISSIRHKIIRMNRQELFARENRWRFEALSSREREILSFLAQGYSSKELGTRLYISTDTVRQHRKNIHKKLDVSSMNGLIDYILAFNLV